MNDRNTELLNEVIGDKLEELHSYASGSEEASNAIDDLNQLYKLRIEEAKVELEFKEKEEARKAENERHASELETKKKLEKAQWILTILNIAVSIGIPIAGWMFTDRWHKRGLYFEEHGTVAAQHNRGLLSTLFNKKR